ncbi:aldo/keto reductase [Clostridium estertheticum]|uniref:aldo/keto reductase n=1 Tax=Clostridium estertheticum TaxID=238834 RepID=UPI001CF257F1|nr:aldo/keto reductase [Clostridium estertheticum]MCB2340757.1 aldo/keto reductase [Clostridium estertheticum]
MGKLCLGTAQFGFNYGINNKTGQPSKQNVFEMLDYAIENGIEYLDTATAYGEAEEIIGEYIEKRNLNKKINIISKLKPNTINEISNDNRNIIRDQIKGSLKRLNVDVLDGYLLHTPTNFYNESTIEELLQCKKDGLVKNIGVSIYEVEHALDVVSCQKIDYIQIPYSVFDQRLNNTNFFEIAKKNNIEVFARSAFIQGLILMDNNAIPHNLEIAKKYLETFDEIVKCYNISRGEAAMLFSYNNSNIDYLVFGVDNLEQLKQNIDLINAKINFKECMNQLLANFKNVEKNIIIPSLWAK